MIKMMTGKIHQEHEAVDLDSVSLFLVSKEIVKR